uniref:Nuclear receptor domain-containing protein n=1 Tax=Meloidogyne floridensis TaxID=298350 RepID=A0A915PE16_9BILA
MEPKNNFQLRKNTLPIKCCICGCIASGFIYYNVKCCDGCKHFFRRCVNAKELFRCRFDGNCDVMANRGRFEKVMPEPLIDLCLQCKNMKLPDLTEYF